MDLPPAVMVHGLRDAQTALSLGKPVTLLSGPGAAMYAGCTWWLELVKAAETPYPALLDCAFAPGRAVEALRAGVKGLVLDCEPILYIQVQELAGLYEALLLPAVPPFLNLAGRGAERRLAAWLDSSET